MASHLGLWDSHQGWEKLGEVAETYTREGESPVADNRTHPAGSRVTWCPWNTK